MNIFILSDNIEENARFHCDRHVVKMQLEHVQMICTTYWIQRILGYRNKLTSAENAIVYSGAIQIRKSENLPFYLPTHVNHPCNLWLRKSLRNYSYLQRLTFLLEKEWKYRYNHPMDKTHKSVDVLRQLPLIEIENPDGFVNVTPYHNLDVISAYRKYYMQEKRSFVKWRKREKPEWYE